MLPLQFLNLLSPSSCCVPLGESPPSPFDKIKCIGHFLLIGHFPGGMVSKPRYFLNDEGFLSWDNVSDPRFVPSPEILADCIDLVSDCLSQAPFEIDISDALSPGDEHAITGGRWYTSNKAMMDLLTSNRDLEADCVDQRDMNQRNVVNWRIWAAQVTTMIVTNGTFLPGQMPKATFHILTQNEVEEFGDQHLTHFYIRASANETDKEKKNAPRVSAMCTGQLR